MGSAIVTIIMPAYNMALYIGDAVRSVLAQTYENWELIIVNDGSTDGTADVLAAFTDPRIHVLHQANGGVAHARNHGLDVASGEFVCFFDADDILPPNSVEARVRTLALHPDAAFADGAVLSMDNATGQLVPRHHPTFHGCPFDRLMAMDPAVFFGPTWMIRREVIGDRRIPVHMTHAEDLAFYLILARDGVYSSTVETILHYRTGHVSAMSDLHGLYQGYRDLYDLARALGPPPPRPQLDGLQARIRRAMSRSFLKAWMPWEALRAFLWLRPLQR